MNTEKRKYPRLSCPNNRFCSFKLEGDRDPSGNVMNISRCGITISSTRPLEKNHIVDLSLSYNDIERQIPSKVKIVWSRPGATLNFYGAEFVDIKTEDKAELLGSFYEDWKKKALDETGSSSDSQKTWVSEGS